jgi:predicted transcriptional regulator
MEISMTPGLLDLILFSEKRKAFLLLLKEGPKNIEEILEKIQVPRTALLPQIKKLKEENLVLHEDGFYKLSIIGEIIVEKMQPLVETLQIFEKNENFWIDRRLCPIPPSLMKRINELGTYHIIEPDLSHTFDLNAEFVNYLFASSSIHIFFSYFHPQFPDLFLRLASKGIEISLVLSEAVCLRFQEDFQAEGEEFLKMENTKLFILERKEIEIPAVVASTDKVMVLGLFNENGRFDRQYIVSSNQRAIKWGEDLFEYYRNMSREIRLDKND